MKYRGSIKKILDILKKVNFKDSLSTLTDCDVLFFCHDANRGMTLNDQAYSPLLDSLRDEFEKKGYKCITIAHPWSKLTGKQGYGSPVAMNGAYLKAKLINKLTPSRLHLRPFEKLYRKILSKTSPLLIVTQNVNDDICKSAREMNIFHAELLHGIGYNPIPWGWGDKNEINLPQCILSLDNISTKTFSPLANKGVIIKEIPHPFLLKFKNKDKSQLPIEWLVTEPTKKYNKEILISLQWGYCYDIDKKEHLKGILSNGLFPEKLVKVIENTKDEILWRFRLHPVQYRQPKKYEKLISFLKDFVTNHSNSEWYESTYLPLPSILERCSGHITMSSMVSYEAAYYGVTTLALCPTLSNSQYSNMFEDLASKKYLMKAELAENEIISWAYNVTKIAPLLYNLDSTYNNSDTIDWLLKQVEAPHL